MNIQIYWIIILGFFFPQNLRAEAFAVIKGVAEGKEVSAEIQLMRVKNGVPVEYAGTTLSEKGSFAFMFEPKENGFYYLYNKETYFRIYVKAGQEIKVGLKDGAWYLADLQSEENRLLADWEKQRAGLKRWTREHDYAAFFAYFETFREKAINRWENACITNEGFAREFRTIVELDLFHDFVSYITKYQQSYESDEQNSLYYRQIIRKFPIQDESLLRQPYGMDLLRQYFGYKHSFIIRLGEYTLEQKLAELNSPVVKAELILSEVDTSSFEHFCVYERKYFPLMQTEEQRLRLRHYPRRPPSSLKRGTAAFNFIFQDTLGQYKAMADFQGKYKYIDIWATWCVPCKKEIPHLQQLEQKLEDKQIEFISISIDKNRKKWKEYVRTQKLGGTQLWAGDWKEFPEELHLGSVPRFLLLDPAGNWVDANAARPSDPQLQKLLEHLTD